MVWHTQGRLTNPTANTILADTGAVVNGGSIDFKMCVAANVAAFVQLEIRNAANDANVQAQAMGVPICEDFANLIELEPGQRIRITLINAITGVIQGSLIRAGS